jgi:hypothetical protein
MKIVIRTRASMIDMRRYFSPLNLVHGFFDIAKGTSKFRRVLMNFRT